MLRLASYIMLAIFRIWRIWPIFLCVGCWREKLSYANISPRLLSNRLYMTNNISCNACILNYIVIGSQKYILRKEFHRHWYVRGVEEVDLVDHIEFPAMNPWIVCASLSFLWLCPTIVMIWNNILTLWSQGHCFARLCYIVKSTPCCICFIIFCF